MTIDWLGQSLIDAIEIGNYAQFLLSRGLCHKCGGKGFFRCLKKVTCMHCAGSGEQGDHSCPRCRGAGEVVCYECQGAGKVTCDACRGSGKGSA